MTDRAALEAETEARIVTWLREQANGFQRTADEAISRGDERAARDRFAAKICCERAAQAIERGEYRGEG
jgi:hypothetical protein